MAAIVSAILFIPLTRQHIVDLEAQLAAEQELAVEAGKTTDVAKDAANGSGSEGEHKDGAEAPALSRTASGRPAIGRTASGKLVGALQRTHSAITMTAESIRTSKTGQKIAKNRIFKIMTYGGPGLVQFWGWLGGGAPRAKRRSQLSRCARPHCTHPHLLFPQSKS